MIGQGEVEEGVEKGELLLDAGELSEYITVLPALRSYCHVRILS